MEREELERLLVDERLTRAQIGARIGVTASAVGKMAKRYRIVLPGRAKYAAKPIDIEEARRLVDEGATLAELTQHFGVSLTTMRKHLARGGLRTRRARGLRAARLASGETSKEMSCREHGLTTFQLDSRGSWRCLRCRSERVAERRRKVKQILLDEAGGRCALCGYDRCARALHFHHRDAAGKAFGVGQGGYTHGIEAIRREAEKCVLLCSNCHAEVESGLVEAP